jgi:AcrR family transcriptional regulator
LAAPGPRARTGRRPGVTGTRERILEAARYLFGERGLDATTIRAIGSHADVDPALVHHYFGTKERLFIAAMQFPFDSLTATATVLAAGVDGIGERMVRLVLSTLASPEIQPRIIGLLRSAVSDPTAAAMARELIVRQGLMEVARAISPSQPELRAQLVGSHLMGLVMARYILRVEPLASADLDAVAAAVGPTIQRYLVGDISRSSRRD